MLTGYTELFIMTGVVLALEYIVPARLRGVLLLAFSFMLYVLSGTGGLFVLPAAGLFIWLTGILLGKAGDGAARKLVFAAGIIIPVAALVFLRYAGGACERIGITQAPIGASFFLLEAVSYVSDCYHKRLTPEKNPVYCLLYLCFFPTITSGPVERGTNLIPQYRELDTRTRRELFDADRICDSMILIIFGMFLKIVIADRLGIVTDNVFDGYYRYGTAELFTGAFAFLIQLYCDFCGYSLIASGMAGLFGIRIMDNFRAPLFSTGFVDYWRRWHISLSSWLRDYIYIPLGGNRHGLVRKYLALAATFIVSGAWHGNGVRFIIWGALHGALVIAENILHDTKVLEKKKELMPAGMHLIRSGITFVLASIVFVFFRAPDTGTALVYIKRMFTRPDLYVLSGPDSMFSYGLDAGEAGILAVALVMVCVVDLILCRRDTTLTRFLAAQGRVFRVVFTLFILLYTVVFGIYGEQVDPGSFIYMYF